MRFTTLRSIRDSRDDAHRPWADFPQRAHRAATSVVGGGVIAHDSVLQRRERHRGAR